MAKEIQSMAVASTCFLIGKVMEEDYLPRQLEMDFGRVEKRLDQEAILKLLSSAIMAIPIITRH
jgi:hypothetical protein